MTFFQAIIYGILQGIGEFLPISSSAHLIAVPQVFKWPDPGLSFDVMLHLGTLVAVVAFFWKDWIRLITAGLKGAKTTDGKLFWFLVVASVPGALIGMALEKKAETAFRSLLLIGIMLIIMGVVLYVVDKYGKKKVPLEKIGLKRSFFIGLAQAFAIVPGVSRSGSTMSMALLFGLTREAAARFSFLLSTPIILGAGLVKLKDIIHTPHDQLPMYIAAFATAAITGFLSIKFLLDYLKNKGFGIFVVYRVVVGLIFIAVALMR